MTPTTVLDAKSAFQLEHACRHAAVDFPELLAELVIREESFGMVGSIGSQGIPRGLGAESPGTTSRA